MKSYVQNRNNLTWSINKENVDTFDYLVVKVYHACNIINAVKALIDQALKAYKNIIILIVQ
jgi:hypothetical protein